MLATKICKAAMSDTLLRGADRMNAAIEQGRVPASYTLRDDQTPVFASVVDYVTEVATRPEHDVRPAFGRIILPPRTGKTVIAAHTIGAMRVPTLFIVPSRTLVEQTYDELVDQLPGIPIGRFYGGEKDVVENGVNIATYEILRLHASMGSVPEPIVNSALIFADEAHRSMTDLRTMILRDAFDPKAIRIAITATPDYNDRRMLVRFFPDLIQEMTLQEALELELLAPVRVWMGEVDVDGSCVEILAGDYREDHIAAVMSEAPFLHAATQIRFAEENRNLHALITCKTVDQAKQLRAYYVKVKPSGTRPPGIILGTSSRDQRRTALTAYEQGRMDTLICVGVLLEGWDAPRCKLLIDLSPSTSRVRAMQKFFRPLTKFGDAEARIFMLVPKNLRTPPILPMEMLGLSGRSYEYGSLIGSRKRYPSESSKPKRPRLSIERVELKSHVQLSADLTKPALNPKRRHEVWKVIASHPQFNADAPCPYSVFRYLRFDHPKFSGTGQQLIRYCGIVPSFTGYRTFLATFFPEAATTMFVRRWSRYRFDYTDESCDEDVALLEDALRNPAIDVSPDDIAQGWRSLRGFDDQAIDRDNPEEQASLKELAEISIGVFLKYCRGCEVQMYLDRVYDNPGALFLRECGVPFNLSPERMRQKFRDMADAARKVLSIAMSVPPTSG